MDEIDVQSLSDEELREQLGSYNVECGPILGSVPNLNMFGMVCCGISLGPPYFNFFIFFISY